MSENDDKKLEEVEKKAEAEEKVDVEEISSTEISDIEKISESDIETSEGNGKAKKKSKADKKKNKKPSLFKRFTVGIKGILSEFQKVKWPTRRELIKETGSCIVICAFFGVIITGMDLILNYVFVFATSLL